MCKNINHRHEYISLPLLLCRGREIYSSLWIMFLHILRNLSECIFQRYLRLFCTYHHLKKYLSILKKVYFNHDLTWFILSVFLTVILLYHFYFILLYFTLLYFTLLYFTLLYFTVLYFTFLLSFALLLLNLISLSYHLIYKMWRYIENGSLLAVLKKFGSFNETLVAIYVTQILKGTYILPLLWFARTTYLCSRIVVFLFISHLLLIVILASINFFRCDMCCWYGMLGLVSYTINSLNKITNCKS